MRRLFLTVLLLSGCGRLGYDALSPDRDAAMPDLGVDAETAAGIRVSRSSGLSTTENGGSDTFTIVLDTAPTSDVTIGLSSSAETEATVTPASVTFTRDNFGSAQTITVTGVDDAVADGDAAFEITLSPAGSADARYNGLDGADVSGVNHDDESPGILLGASGTLATSEDGDNATFTIVLQSQPAADVRIPVASNNEAEGTLDSSSIVFTSTDWDVPRVVTVHGVDDALIDGDVAYAVQFAPTSSADANYTGLGIADVNVVNTDNDSAGLGITPRAGLVTTELGGSATFDVTLSAIPTASVELAVGTSDPTEGTLTPSTLVFDPLNWNVAQQVEIVGVDDDVADGAQTYDAVLHVMTSGDPTYAGLADTHIAITNTDNETPGVIVAPTSGLTTNEVGTTATFTVVLTSEPTADVVIALTSGNPSEGSVSPNSLTFTPASFSEPQLVTVTGIDDAVADGDVAYTVITSAAMSDDGNYSSMLVDDVSVINADNDTASIVATPAAGLVTTEAGGTATFDVVLSSEPRASVNVSVTSTDVAEGTVAPAALVFTPVNWNVPQAVVVTGVDDAVADGAQSYAATLHVSSSSDATYSAVADASVTISNADDETAGITVNPTAGLVTTELGGTATFDIVLTSEPTADVTIPISSSNLLEGTVSPASLTFTSGNWSVPQTVTVTGVNDHYLDGDTSYLARTGTATSADLSYNTLDSPDVSVVNHGAPAQEGPPTVTPTAGFIWFGYSIAMSGDGNTVAVGAKIEQSSATGINGDPLAMPSADDSGAVWVYVRSGSNWVVQAYIKASNTDAFDTFGSAVALSTDGNTLVVGAPAEDSDSSGINGLQGNAAPVWESGAAYVFSRSGTTWTQSAYVKASLSHSAAKFGTGVALSDDGNTMAIAAQFEASNATGIGGDESNTTAVGSGAVYVFLRSGGVWAQQAYVKASNTNTNDWFGYSVELSGDGDTLAVAARMEQSAAAGIDGDQLDNTMVGCGAAYVFTRSGGSWAQQAYLKASNPYASLYFGEEMQLSGDGSTLVVTALGERSNAVGVNGNQTNHSFSQAGAAYVFDRTGAAWSQVAYLKASNTEASDRFGSAAAMSADGNLIAVGAQGERSGSPGIGGDQSDNSRPGSGAVYVFARAAGEWEQRLYIKSDDPQNGAYFGYALSMSDDGNTLAASDTRIGLQRFSTFTGN